MAKARLVLDVPGAHHFEAWAAAHAGSAPAVSPWDIAPRLPEERTEADFERLLAHLVEHRAVDRPVWFVRRLADDAFIGTVSLFDVTRNVSQSAFAGFHVFNQHTGHGYATEALRLLVERGFDELGLHRIEACAEVGNDRSIAVMRKAGFRHEGTARNRFFMREAWRDAEVFAITVEDLGRTWAPPADAD